MPIFRPTLSRGPIVQEEKGLVPESFWEKSYDRLEGTANRP